MLVVADLAGARVPGWWLQMCVAGIVLGLLGLRFVAPPQGAAAAETAPPVRCTARPPPS